MKPLHNNERIEELRDEVLALEATGFLPKFDYQTCQPVYAPRTETDARRPA
ncbi:MAG TPA: hypothetical protein VLC71_06005 [Thermomonas sp.]|nr:hypothetical protein [Thermomonas sp.]